MPLSELYTEQVPEDVMPPTLVLFNEQVGGTNDQLPLFAEACDFLQDQGLLKYLVEVHHDNNYLRKLIKDSSFCNRGFSLLVCKHTMPVSSVSVVDFCLFIEY